MKKLVLSILTALTLSIGAYAQCFTPVWSASSQDTMYFHITQATLNGTDLQIGDQIGIFDGALCVGEGTLTQVLTGGASLEIMTLVNNSGTGPVDGYTDGNAYSFQFCQGSVVSNPAVVSNLVSGSAVFAVTTGRDSAVVQLSSVNTPPVYTAVPDTVATEDVLYSSTVSATDGDGDGIVYSATETPVWATFTPATRTLSGTPGNEHVGFHNVTLSITDGTDVVDSSYQIRVANVNDAPTFTSMPDTVATEDVLYSSAILASDIDAEDSLIYAATTLPPWGTFNDTTGVLSGTPGNEHVGFHDVTLTISDGTVTLDSSFQIRVANVNDAPTFETMPDTVATEDVLYSSAITAADIDEGDSLIYAATTLPPWGTFNDTTGVLSGTPGNEHVGFHDVTLTISDGTVTLDSSFQIRVANANDAPTFETMPDTVATEDVLYSSAIAGADIDVDDSLIYAATTLPVWGTFNDTTGVLSGTPGNEHVGFHDVTLTISDGTVTLDSSFQIRVANANDAPTFETMPDTVALEDMPYSSAVVGADIDVGDSLIYSAPVLPAWLTFNDTTGVLSGTAGDTLLGDHNVTLRLSDGTVNVDSAFVITLLNTNDAPTFATMPDTIALEDMSYSSAVTGADVDIGDSLIYSAPLLPEWLTFNDTTGVLSGTAGDTLLGDHNVTLRISDGTVNVDSSFIITLVNTNDPPAFTSVPDTIAIQGDLYSYTPTAVDIDGDTLFFSAPVLPIWLSFDSATHVLSGTPGNDHVGDNSVSLMITDTVVNVVQSFVIEVENINDPPAFTSTPITEARPGVAYEYLVTAEDVDGDSLTFTALVLPGWLTFDASSQLLSATPSDTDVGDQFATIRVSDGILFADQTFVVSVSYANHAPNFISDPATTVVVGEAYIYTINAYDIDGDELTYSAPVLPDWLTFYPQTHVISGIPQTEDLGPHDVTVSVSDGTVSAQQSFPLTVLDINSAPEFTSTPVTSVIEDHLFVYYVTAEDANGDDLSFSAILLPDWLVFDPLTGILHGTPDHTDIGDHNVTLSVSDGELSTEQNFTITVEAPSGVGFKDLNSPDFMIVYPNPTQGRFIVEMAAGIEQELHLEILDPLGRIVIQKQYPPYYWIWEEFDLSDRPAGLYFIRIYHESDQAIRKLIVQ